MKDTIKQFIEESFKDCPSGSSTKHFERTAYWAKQLNPNADEPILISAYAHDIARAFRETNTAKTFKDKEFNDPDILKGHQEEGAKIISEFLEKEGYDKESINRVYNMIRYHEEGGNEEVDLVKDADSISYLENNAIKHIKMIDKLGKDKVKKKIDWMYDRISSDKAKKLAKPFYEEAISLIEK